MSHQSIGRYIPSTCRFEQIFNRMSKDLIKVVWPNGRHTFVRKGSNWLAIANEAGVEIPTGCLNGSCGACEIEVNGKVLRACITMVSEKSCQDIKVNFYADPFW